MPPVDRRSLSARPRRIPRHPGRVDEYVHAWFSNTPKMDNYFRRLGLRDEKPIRNRKARNGFTLEDSFYLFAETLDGSGEFTSARFNDWLITHRPTLSRSVRGIGGFLFKKRMILGIEQRYRDPNHEMPLVWGLREGWDAELSKSSI